MGCFADGKRGNPCLFKEEKNVSLLIRSEHKGKITPDSEPASLVIHSKLELFQLLIPIALERVNEILQDEVTSLAGPRYARDTTNRSMKRWGKQRSSVHLADQKVPLRVPRVRDVQRNGEIPLTSYHQLQRPRATEEQLLVRIIRGLSCQNYDGDCLGPHQSRGKDHLGLHRKRH
ncbi:MAG: hypothetical protein ONB46_01800 [candidate division KSB1 bacterium]|nr:hypothetical protein [candidate division KSB1 bacterium]MDZ7364401.1 hypothetical protein [candidate division KSB1 bacterium]MDZ7402773.1 hypothetical protein [candidate division KSB1 bacterium]